MEHHFQGETYRAEWDYDRLKNNRQRVLYVLLDGRWYHITELRKVGGDAADMRVRELRSDWCGAMKVDERRDPGGLSYYRLDLTSVDEAWVRRVLNCEVQRPKKEDNLPDTPEEMLVLLTQSVRELVGLENLNHAKNIYKKIRTTIERRKTPPPEGGAFEGHPDKDSESIREFVLDASSENLRPVDVIMRDMFEDAGL